MSEADDFGTIAVIGMSGRFPGARNLDEFWANLKNGRESITFFSDEELAKAGVNPSVLQDPNYVKAGAVLEDIDLFDTAFFGFSPAEATYLDPQQRLFMECAWEAIERAGYNLETTDRYIGVYAGSSLSFYLLSNLLPSLGSSRPGGELFYFLGNDKDYLTTHLSYKLNLKGPSIGVQTACSTSLVAICLACQGLLNYQCDMALAGGVTVRVPQKAGYFYEEGGIVSVDGHCRAFDARGQGPTFGSGVGVVVLKRLADARTDGDYIHAVIKGTAINNDGAAKVGYTAPSVGGQAEVIASAHADAGVSAETIGYVETHGTGTPLGDPIEVAALTQAFRTSTQQQGFCALGSVKTNVGHLDAAAGVAGFIKTVLSLNHKLLPPSLHFETPNPEIDFAGSPFYVNTRLSEWTTNGTPRRAGVSSFGIGGTNAHAILEEAPQREPSGRSRSWQLLLLSARTQSALDAATVNLRAHLKQHPDINLADAAYTLQVGRQAFDRRRMLVCRDIADAVTTLEQLDDPSLFTGSVKPTEPSIAFMFSGQGTQAVNMGLDLYAEEPTFREQVDLCAEMLKPHLGLDLRQVLYPPTAGIDEAAGHLAQTAMAQPALFVIEYALARLWLAWGVRPAAMIGHSIGEYVAACLAGVFSLTDALSLVAARGRLMQQLPVGAMLAVSLPVSEVQSFLSQGLSLAAVNGPSQCVISGTEGAVEAVKGRLDQAGIACRRLRTSHAFHSEMMEPILDAFAAQVKQVTLHPPQIPYVSNLTGIWITAAEATDPIYWAKHIRQPVRFATGLAELLTESSQILLEVGSGQTLATLAKQQNESATDSVVLASLPDPKAQASDVKFFLTTLGQLWLAGAAVDWSGFYAHERRQRLPLPTYPFERRRYWIEPQAIDTTATTLVRKADLADWFYLPSWKRSVISNGYHRHDRFCWLLFVDEGGLGSRLAKQLEQKRQDVIIVRTGSEFARLGDRLYTLNPEQRADYHKLLAELQVRAKRPDKIIHLWSVTDDKASAHLNGDNAQLLGFYSLLYLAQALGESNFTPPLSLIVVSNHLQEVTGEERLCPEKATVLGPIKVIPQEYPNISCRSVDVDSSWSDPEREQALLDQLLAEFTGAASEAVVAYRGKHRWTQTFEPVRLEASGCTPSRLRPEGVYLIVGGLGGVGLALAEYLVQTVSARVILTGRSAFPPRDEWDNWLATHAEQETTSLKIRKVQALEARGARVLVIQADVANRAQMKRAIKESLAQFGQIDGVIHAAGVLNADLIQFKTPELTASTFASKVKGTQVLLELLKNIELDFLIFCSSLSSVAGGPGLVDYAAANAFLDATVQASRKSGKFVASINWDVWQGIGMAVEAVDGSQQYLPQTGLSPSEGREIFGRILDEDLSQVLVSTHNLQLRVDQSQAKGRTRAIFEKIASQPRPELKNAYVAPRNDTEQKLATIWQDLLGFEQLGIHDNFFELGGDSLLSIQVISRAKQAGLQLTITQLLQHQTLVQLAKVAGTNETVQTEQGPRDGASGFHLRENDRIQPPMPDDDGLEAARSSLVPIQSGGSKPPFFCVHPLLGVVFPYFRLARNMGNEQPFYALQSVGLDGKQPPYTCFQDMAAHYIKAIRTVQPAGPYFLGGWSLGSWIAFEMAQQLRQAGDEVGLLAIIDTGALIQAPNRWQNVRSSLALTGLLLRDIWPFVHDYYSLMSTAAGRSKHFNKNQGAISAGSPILDGRQPFVRHMFKILWANMRAVSRYSSQPYPAPISLFRPVEYKNQQLHYHDEDPTLGWAALTAQVTIYDVPGNHFTVMREPNVAVLARQLWQCMNSQE